MGITIDITERLEAAARDRASELRRDDLVTRMARLMRKTPPEDQMIAIAAYQASLIIEIADADREKVKAIWQAAWHLSGVMIRDFTDSPAPTNQ